jgi:acetolactate synthase regulatory subunit
MVILKLDFEKAFETIEREGIIRVLRHKGFPRKWVE